MKFSICIPNYNYAQFLGDTLRSVLQQDHADVEVLVSDNASTDDSVNVVQGFDDPRIHFRINHCNVGFAGNLDRAGRMATGERMIMLSSDDLMCPGALSAYDKICQRLGADAEKVVLCSAVEVINAERQPLGRIGRDENLWLDSDRVPELDDVAGGDVYCVDASDLLRRSLKRMTNPFNFLATCYPRSLYEAVEGYGGGRLVNPDKYFHWKLLGVADRAYFVEKNWFAYRWHNNNQSAQQLSVGALKHLIDEYASTLELDHDMLARIGLTREDVCDAFIEHDILRHGLATLARGNRARAQRIVRFGRAVYPDRLSRNRKSWLVTVLLATGALGQWAAACGYRRYRPGPGPTGV